MSTLDELDDACRARATRTTAAATTTLVRITTASCGRFTSIASIQTACVSLQ
jgi:hypothetical protein